jgi:hypothetical protein
MGEVIHLFERARQPHPDDEPTKPLGPFIKRLAFGCAVVPGNPGLFCRICGGYGQTAADLAHGHSDACLLAGFDGSDIHIPTETEDACSC